MASRNDLRIAIVGGGMVGVACAVKLMKAGLDVNLFEAASRFGELGAGVGIGPNGLRALEALGISKTLHSEAENYHDMETFQYISDFPGHELIFDYPSRPSKLDVGMAIHRAEFLSAVVGLLDSKRTHFNKRLVSISQSRDSEHSTSTLHFQDDTTFEADVVIGADGIRSTARSFVSGTNSRPVFTNTVAYRALISGESIKQANLQTNLLSKSTNFMGRDRHIIIFPLKNGQIINVVIFCTDRSKGPEGRELPLDKWVTTVDKQELVQNFDGCGPDTQAIISLFDDKPKKWAIHELRPTLTSYTHENIALVGDAAHGSSPHLGAGVGQGFEDAHFICELLVDPRTNAQNLQDVLKVYDRYRRPRANEVLNSSAATSDLYESWREDSVAEKFHSPLGKLFGWVFDHDLQADINAGRRDLENSGIWQSST